MGVFIKGMEMPKSCSKCGWFDMGGGYGYQCTLSHKSFDMWNKISVARDNNCPLVEIPTPHGRLINADKLMMSLADWWYSSFGQTETEESKAIKTVLDKIENSIDLFAVAEGET